MKEIIPPLFYGSLMVGAAVLAWFGSDWTAAMASPAATGSCLSAIFAAIYIGELKQESIGQFYQALAASSLKSAEQAAFNEEALAKVRQIRRIFLLSNIVKLIGLVAAVYMVNEKSPGTSFDWAQRASLFCVGWSLVLFARLWSEVSASERLLITIKTESMLEGRRAAFLKDSEAKLVPSESATAMASYERDAKTLPWKKAQA